MMRCRVIGMSWSSLSARGAWIEITSLDKSQAVTLSLSARGAWIEINTVIVSLDGLRVALRKGSVD